MGTFSMTCRMWSSEGGIRNKRQHTHRLKLKVIFSKLYAGYDITSQLDMTIKQAFHNIAVINPSSCISARKEFPIKSRTMVFSH